jgi:hypothetical protein
MASFGTHKNQKEMGPNSFMDIGPSLITKTNTATMFVGKGLNYFAQKSIN